MAVIKFTALLTLTTFAGPPAVIATRQVPPNSQDDRASSSLPYDQVAISDCTVPNTVALAFDDGPHMYTEELLRILDNHGAKATFFVNGNNYSPSIDSFAALLQKEVDEGHQIGSHTWDHKLHLDEASCHEIVSEMQKLDDKLYELIQRRPTYMRPPFLAYNDTVLEILKDYHVITTNLDTEDTRKNVSWSTRLFNQGLKPGKTLILAHDTLEPTAAQLAENMLNVLDKEGYQAVSVGECLGDPPENWYRKDPVEFSCQDKVDEVYIKENL